MNYLIKFILFYQLFTKYVTNQQCSKGKDRLQISRPIGKIEVLKYRKITQIVIII